MVKLPPSKASRSAICSEASGARHVKTSRSAPLTSHRPSGDTASCGVDLGALKPAVMAMAIGYHLVMTNIAMENPNHNWRFIAGKIIYFYGPFSEAMLNNQRVITGYFYGIIHSINGVLLLLITGNGP